MPPRLLVLDRVLRRPLLLGVATILATGCATVEPHLVPAPAVFKDARLSFDQTRPVELKSTQVPVFFATTRAATQGPEHFGNDSARLTLGIAQVRLGEPGWSWDQLVESDRTSTVDKARNGAVESVEILGRATDEAALSKAERAFVAAIDAQLARIQNPELVFYVHGYRVTFDEVAVQMGSFAHYLGQQATVTFQWPTGTMFWNYLTDCPRAQRYIPDIERMLALLAQTKAQHINVLAYSCGSPLLASALDRLRARHPALDHDALQSRYRLGNVIFVASDVDLKTFARDHVQPALDLARQVIVYFSQIDRALGFSSLLAGASRLGQPDISDLSVDEIQRLSSNSRFQAVDVTNVRGAHEMGGMKGHGYWYANEIISTDVALSLRYPIPPAQRCLINPEGKRVWNIPDDYVDCVANRLLQRYPALRR
ncbi:MAG TPA: alpha/beta hydrolase [Burkholderiaceae bacterium]|nr:alpha/beta hydrolase [Burkholderiaceae bacterium]